MSHINDLREAGLRSTLPRLKILSILESSETRHLSAEDVYRTMMGEDDSISMATVYRVLTQFEDAGLVIRHNFEGERAVFELNDADHHDHMVCVECGSVTEFIDCGIEKLQNKVASKHGFKIQDHSLTLFGLCANCHDKNNS